MYRPLEFFDYILKLILIFQIFRLSYGGPMFGICFWPRNFMSWHCQPYTRLGASFSMQPNIIFFSILLGFLGIDDAQEGEFG